MTGNEVRMGLGLAAGEMAGVVVRSVLGLGMGFVGGWMGEEGVAGGGLAARGEVSLMVVVVVVMLGMGMCFLGGSMGGVGVGLGVQGWPPHRMLRWQRRWRRGPGCRGFLEGWKAVLARTGLTLSVSVFLPCMCYLLCVHAYMFCLLLETCSV